MPHLLIEYSNNLTERHRVDIDAVVDALHDAAIATGTAAPDALRTRAVGREHYAVGDRDPDNSFVAVMVRLGPGRELDEHRRLVDALLETLDVVLGDARQTSMLSVEVQEIDPDRRQNRNHARQQIAARMAASPSAGAPS